MNFLCGEFVPNKSHSHEYWGKLLQILIIIVWGIRDFFFKTWLVYPTLTPIFLSNSDNVRFSLFNIKDRDIRNNIYNKVINNYKNQGSCKKYILYVKAVKMKMKNFNTEDIILRHNFILQKKIKTTLNPLSNEISLYELK